MKEYIKKADILIEALPYIQLFKDEIVVIKFGGSIQRSMESMTKVLQDIVFMRCIGWKPVVIHGGGPAISEAMEERDIKPEFVNGLRKTDKKTMDIVEDILANKINSQIVNIISRLNSKATGISGRYKELLKVDKVIDNDTASDIDYGYVGHIRKVNRQVVLDILNNGRIPVIAPIGVGDDNASYNVNADVAAGEIASSIGAIKLVYLTDTPGILEDPDDENTLISTLTAKKTAQMLADGSIAGGMIPKVTSCLKALRFGVNKGHIIDGRMEHSLLLEIFTDKGIGTEIINHG